MGETEKLDKAPKESWFTGLSAEFKITDEGYMQAFRD